MLSGVFLFKINLFGFNIFNLREFFNNINVEDILYNSLCVQYNLFIFPSSTAVVIPLVYWFTKLIGLPGLLSNLFIDTLIYYIIY